MSARQQGADPADRPTFRDRFTFDKATCNPLALPVRLAAHNLVSVLSGFEIAAVDQYPDRDWDEVGFAPSLCLAHFPRRLRPALTPRMCAFDIQNTYR